MALLQCLTFNCRGWTSGKQTLHNLIGFLDLCFIQEHWLLHDQLYEFHPDFHSISLSGVDNSVFLHGRPYGGCAILYRKSLCSSITPLFCDSDRFCAIKLYDSCGISVLVCVYMPSQSHSLCFDEYLGTLGELEGFLEFHKCDVNLLVGDFNVNFSRGSCQSQLLLDFMEEWDLCACDLSFSDPIQFTYERDDGLVRSWVDHVLCSNCSLMVVPQVTRVLLGSNLSDHHPLAFSLNVDCSLVDISPQSSSSSLSLDWDKASREDYTNL